MQEYPFCQEYLNDRLCDLKSWPYQVKVPIDIEHNYHHKISTWCFNNLDNGIFDKDIYNWRPALSGSPSMSSHLYCVWLFKHQDHAIQFQMTWA